MKRVLTALLMLLLAASLFAGGIENKNNMSAGYLRNPSKNTETKKPDAVFYNPAGTAFMEEGLYFELGNQFLFKDYTNDASDIANFEDKYSSTDPVLLYPSGEIVWNGGNFALFGGFGVAAGGGTAEYKDGSFLSTGALLQLKQSIATATGGAVVIDTDHSLDISAIIFGETIGASYAVNDMISLSVGIRLLQGKITQKITLDNEYPAVSLTENVADTEVTASGFGGIFGIHLNPTEELDVALQYQTKIAMEYEYDKVKGFSSFLTAMQIEKGDKYDKDLPAMLGIGVGYQLLDSLYTSLSFNYYFNKAAAFETGVQDGENEYNDSWEIAAGAEYTLNKMVALSGGILYSKQGFKDDENSAEVPLLDSITIGAGAGLTFIEDLIIDLAVYKPIYFDSDYETAAGDITLSKKLFLIGIGATYKL